MRKRGERAVQYKICGGCDNHCSLDRAKSRVKKNPLSDGNLNKRIIREKLLPIV